MTDFRSGRRHGPNCQAKITEASESGDFCGDDCQTAWNALHALPPMPSLSIHLPASSLARWTPEGGAPVTPETSTWQPTRVSWVPELADLEHPTTAELMAGTSETYSVVDETAAWVGLRPGDLLILGGEEYRVVESDGPNHKIMPIDEEPGEAATQSPIQKPLSFMSRLWRWVWFRG